MASSEIIAKEASPYIVLNFYGKITRAPEKNNILVCECFNMKFYIDGSSCFDYTSTDSFVTAWMVPMLKPKAVAKARGARSRPDDASSQIPTMVLKEKVVMFEFSWRTFLKKNKEPIFNNDNLLLMTNKLFY